jgi:multiple sugar transport system substrate-binding protein
MNTTIRWITVFALSALILAACGPNRDDDGGGTSSEPESGALDARGEIFVLGESYETSDEIAQGRIDYFRDEFPDVTVKFSESEFDSQQFLTAARASDPPDVVRMPRERIGSYVARGVLEPLDSCISRSSLSMDDFYPAAVSQVTVDGSIYGIPLDYGVTNWLIDNDLFEDAGLDPAEWDVSDWEAIAEANRALRDAGALVGVDPKVSDEGDRFPMWVWANGGQMISDDGTESLLDTPEVIEALAFVKSIIDEYGGHTKFLDDRGNTGDFFAAEQFTEDTEGAFPMQQFYLNVIAGSAPDTAFTARPFLTREGEPLTLAEGTSLSIVASSDNKDAACAYITGVVTTEAWLRGAEARRDAAEEDETPQTGTSPANRVATEQIFDELVDLSDHPDLEEAVQVYLDTLETAFYMPTSPAAEEFRRAWIGAVTSVLNGEAEPEEALLAADEEAQAAIDSAGP